MRMQNAGGSGGNVISSVRKEVKKYTALGNNSSMANTVELIPLTGPGAGKIPKSPAPNPTLFQDTV